MRVVMVTGMPGSGKTAFREVAKGMGLPIVTMGDVVREHAAAAGLKPDDVSIGTFAGEERKRRGDDIWARRTLDRLRKMQAVKGAVVIDGVRSLAEVKRFRAALGRTMVLTAIHASPAVRFRRLKTRGRADDPRAPAHLSRRDGRELAWGLGTAIALADESIVNEGSIELFRRRCRALLKKYTGG